MESSRLHWILTMRPSPSIKSMMYGLRFCPALASMAQPTQRRGRYLQTIVFLSQPFYLGGGLPQTLLKLPSRVDGVGNVKARIV